MINSDLPGEPWMPMETLYFAVTRKDLNGNPENGWYADQALTVQEALYGMTRANAHGAFQEQKLGQLTTGYWADFIVVDQNPFETEPDELKNIKILQTWVSGARVPF